MYKRQGDGRGEACQPWEPDGHEHPGHRHDSDEELARGCERSEGEREPDDHSTGSHDGTGCNGLGRLTSASLLRTEQRPTLGSRLRGGVHTLHAADPIPCPLS